MADINDGMESDLLDDQDNEVEYREEDEPLDIDINLDNDVYFVDQDVKGTIIINNPVTRKMRGIKLTLKCRGEVLWLDPSRKSKNMNDVTFMQVEQYILGDGKLTTLERGIHELEFCILLDSKCNLPSSMELPHGHIRYKLTAELDWPWAEARLSQKLISVLNKCDLHDYREALQPATFTKQCKIGLSRKRINISGRLEKIAYVPGENIILNVEINNQSSKMINNCFLRLNSIAEYTSSDGRHFSTKNTVSEKKLPSIPGHSDYCPTNESLLVPSVPQSAFSSCEFLKIKYEVELSINEAGLNKSAKNGIFIGTLPTKNHYKRFVESTVVSPVNAVWPYDTTILSPPLLIEAVHDPMINYAALAQEDSNYKVYYAMFQFDLCRALHLIETGEEDDSDMEYEDEGSDVMSEFSL